MNIPKFFFFNAFIFFACTNIMSQTENRAIVLSDTLEGTYEIIPDDEKLQEIFTTDILFEIEKNRHDTDVVYIRAGKQTTIKILPKSVIYSEEFRNKRRLQSN
jgi:hypothetical protein